MIWSDGVVDSMVTLPVCLFPNDTHKFGGHQGVSMDATKSNGDEISCVFMSIDDPKELQM